MSNNTDGSGPGDVAALVTQAEQDNQILVLRLAGLSIKRLSREFKKPERAILDALDRGLPQLTPELRVRLFKEDLARCEDLMVHWYAQAKGGSAVATNLCIQLMRRRAAMVGSDAPANLRVQVIAEATAAEMPNSTQLLLKELDRIAAERTDGGLLVEHEADGPPSGLPSEPA